MPRGPVMPLAPTPLVTLRDLASVRWESADDVTQSSCVCRSRLLREVVESLSVEALNTQLDSPGQPALADAA